MPGDRQEADYKRIYVPERLGGDGNEVALSGQNLILEVAHIAMQMVLL